ncbi:MAG TPA: iron ABC transporter permease [Haliangiales bacterium]|nr:iron ABC transporter permease [Haliangiales bacterium]
MTRRRLALVVAACGGAFVAAAALALLLGAGADGRLAILDLRRALGETGQEAQIFFLSRLPRAVAAAIAGAGLAAAGATYQALLRNPLAEPYTLGVSSGAALGAVLAIRLGLETVLGTAAVPLLAFAGSLAAIGLIWRLAAIGTARPPATLLLAGLTLAFLCSAATMLVLYTASFHESYRIIRWLMGGLDWVPTADLVRSGAVVAVGLGALVYIARDLNALAAGADAAASVGVPVNRVVGIGFVAASLTVGAVIAFSGPIGFVGIIVPHILRALWGPDHRALLPACILGGAAFVLVADTVARTLLAPQQIPVGVVTALLGGPFFLSLLRARKLR